MLFNTMYTPAPPGIYETYSHKNPVTVTHIDQLSKRVDVSIKLDPRFSPGPAISQMSIPYLDVSKARISELQPQQKSHL